MQKQSSIRWAVLLGLLIGALAAIVQVVWKALAGYWMKSASFEVADLALTGATIGLLVGLSPRLVEWWLGRRRSKN